MGPIISAAQYDRVVGYLEIGQKEADLVFGGRHGAELVAAGTAGRLLGRADAIHKRRTTRCGSARRRSSVRSAVAIPFDTEEEALAIANDCRYGLASGVWTADLARAHRFIREIESGNVWVNTYLQTRYELPFGGIKDSGYGHDDVVEFTREKSAVIVG